jgi:hypothetical protein
LNLVARWRFFKDWPGVRVEFVFEASKQSALADIGTKSITIWLDGQPVFSLPNKTIGAGQRFRVVKWIGAKPPVEDFDVRQDRVYLRDMNVVPLYDLNHPLGTKDVDTVIGSFFKNKSLDPANYDQGLPLVNGILVANQNQTGDRADIDPQPDWATCTWNSEDPRAAQVQMSADGNNAGAFPVHIRDPNSDEMGLKYNYHITQAKGKWNNPCIPNRAHHALVGFISYVITGDKYYAEELSAWATFCTREWPWDGKFKYPGSRDDAWTSRAVPRRDGRGFSRPFRSVGLRLRPFRRSRLPGTGGFSRALDSFQRFRVLRSCLKGTAPPHCRFRVGPRLGRRRRIRTPSERALDGFAFRA